MSCLHENHPNNCEICAEAETAYIIGYQDGKTKPWVGLTDDEIEACQYEIRVKLMGAYDYKDIYRVLEAKLKEKNT